MSDTFTHTAQLCAICYCPHLPKQTNIVKPQKVLSSAANMHGMNVPWDCSIDEVVDQCECVCVTYMFSLSGLQGLGRVVVELGSTKSNPVFRPRRHLDKREWNSIVSSTSALIESLKCQGLAHICYPILVQRKLCEIFLWPTNPWLGQIKMVIRKIETWFTGDDSTVCKTKHLRLSMLAWLDEWRIRMN